MPDSRKQGKVKVSPYMIHCGVSRIVLGLPPRNGKPDELLTALNCFADIFDVTGQACGAIINVAVSRLAEKGIVVKWNTDTRRFER